MAAEACESEPVAGGAGCLIQIQFARTVVREEALDVTRRGKLHCLRVAGGAGIGRIDLGMANEAVGHLGQIGVCNHFRFFQAAVTGDAGVLVAFEMAADVGWGFGGKVVFLVDSGCDHLRHVAELKVLLVAEAADLRGFRLANDEPAEVTAHAGGLVGKIVVLYLGAGSDGGVAVRALRNHFQVELMREIRSLGAAQQKSRAEDGN